MIGKMNAEGIIYFIKCEDYVKIGFTTLNPKIRLESMQCGNPFEMCIIRTITGFIWQERWLHRQLQKYRHKGEWYKYIEHIQTIIPPTEIPEELLKYTKR